MIKEVYNCQMQLTTNLDRYYILAARIELPKYKSSNLSKTNQAYRLGYKYNVHQPGVCNNIISIIICIIINICFAMFFKNILLVKLM